MYPKFLMRPSVEKSRPSTTSTPTRRSSFLDIASKDLSFERSTYDKKRCDRNSNEKQSFFREQRCNPSTILIGSNKTKNNIVPQANMNFQEFLASDPDDIVERGGERPIEENSNGSEIDHDENETGKEYMGERARSASIIDLNKSANRGKVKTITLSPRVQTPVTEPEDESYDSKAFSADRHTKLNSTDGETQTVSAITSNVAMLNISDREDHISIKDTNHHPSFIHEHESEGIRARAVLYSDGTVEDVARIRGLDRRSTNDSIQQYVEKGSRSAANYNPRHPPPPPAKNVVIQDDNTRELAIEAMLSVGKSNGFYRQTPTSYQELSQTAAKAYTATEEQPNKMTKYSPKKSPDNKISETYQPETLTTNWVEDYQAQNQPPRKSETNRGFVKQPLQSLSNVLIRPRRGARQSPSPRHAGEDAATGKVKTKRNAPTHVADDEYHMAVNDYSGSNKPHGPRSPRAPSYPPKSPGPPTKSGLSIPSGHQSANHQKTKANDGYESDEYRADLGDAVMVNYMGEDVFVIY